MIANFFDKGFFRIQIGDKVPNAFLPWLAMDCTNTRNYIPNARSSTRMPEEIVTGSKINFRTHITASFGQLVLVKSNKIAPDGTPITKQKYAVALGRVIVTTGSVWVYRMNASRVVPRRVVKAVPMTEEWRQHLNDLAKSRPIDPAKFFEFKSTLAYGPEDQDDVERATVQPSVKRSEIQPQSLQPDPTPIPAEVVQPVQAPTPGKPSTIAALPRVPATPRPQQSVSPEAPESPAQPRRVSFGPAPASIAPVQPVAADPAPVQVPSPQKEYGRGKRGRVPNRQMGPYSVNSIVHNKVYSVELVPDTADDVKWLHINNLVSDHDRGENMFVMMGAHEDYWDRVAMQITLELALKTQYKAQVEASAVAECKNILNFKTFRYLRDKSQAEKTIHPEILPCSMVVKDKRDSKGELLLWKSRLATGGHLTNPDTYQPFDKTSPTASMDAVYTALAIMQSNRMNMEVCDVPSAYLNTPLPKGKKHIMRIKPSIAKYFVLADPSAREFLQRDNSLLVQLEKALYGLPEAGKLWHELLRDCLKACGYTHRPNDTTTWKRVEKKDGKVISVSIILVFVDDFMHIWKTFAGSDRIRDKLHADLSTKGLPPLKCSRLTENNSVSFLGLSIQLLPGFRLFVSQPGYATALAEQYPFKRKQNSPLPPDFNSRTVSEEDQELLGEADVTRYRKEIMSIAWLVRTRPNIAAAVAHKQTRCSNPRVIDQKDLDYMIGFIANNINAGIVIDCRDTQLYLYVDVGHATHEDKKSHTGGMVTMGKLGEGGVPIVWKSLKQKVVSLHSTSAELIGLSDMFDLLQCANDLMQFLQPGRQQLPFTVFQDNTSTITIAYMGRSSSHAKRRFIEIRYFWFKEHLDGGFAKLDYLRSEDHPADLLASVRSGAEFKHFTNLIMGTI